MTSKFYSAVCAWNRKKSLKTFKQLYKDGFNHGWFWQRAYGIIKNTKNGTYAYAERVLKARGFKEVHNEGQNG